MTTLSIVCPFRDARPYLRTLFTSLDRANLSDWELILVDDGSVDDPGGVADWYIDRWGCVKYLRLDESVGLASARNRGLEVASGDLIAFVDADDWVGTDYFDTMIRSMDRTDADFGRTNQTRVTGKDRSLASPCGPGYDYKHVPHEWILPENEPTMVDFPYAHSAIFNRRLIDRGLLQFPEGLRTAEDRPWIWNLHLHAESFVRIPTYGYYYRRGVSSSLTQIGDVRQLDFLRSFELVLKLVLSDPSFAIYVPKAVRQTLAVVHHHLASSDRLEQGLRERMLRELPALISLIPTEHMAAQLGAIGVRRADLVRRYIPELHAL